MDATKMHTKAPLQTPLHAAARLGDKRECKALIKQYLLARKGGVDPLDSNGNTPLHIAALKGHYTICELLIKNGANPSMRNLRGQIPYDVRKRGLKPSLQEDFAELLIPHGTTSDTSSSDSETDDSATEVDPVEGVAGSDNENNVFNVRRRSRSKIYGPARYSL